MHFLLYMDYCCIENTFSVPLVWSLDSMAQKKQCHGKLMMPASCITCIRHIHKFSLHLLGLCEAMDIDSFVEWVAKFNLFTFSETWVCLKISDQWISAFLFSLPGVLRYIIIKQNTLATSCLWKNHMMLCFSSASLNQKDFKLNSPLYH